MAKRLIKVVGDEALNLLKMLMYPKTLRDASIAEIQQTFLRFVRPAQFEIAEKARFHSLVRNPNETAREFMIRHQSQASKYNFATDWSP